MNNTNLILSDESEKMKNRELLEEYFSCSLEMDLLLRLYPDDEDTLYQIVNLLVDTCATNRKLLHIAGDDKPAEVVRSRFMKLNADHGEAWFSLFAICPLQRNQVRLPLESRLC